MPLSDIVNIIVSLNAGTKVQTGYGIPLFLSATQLFTEHVRYYTSLAGLVSDGFLTTDPEYLAAQVVFSQNPRPKKLGIGRLEHRPAKRWAITPVAITNMGVYRMVFDGHAITYTADSATSASEIVAGLKAAIDALAISGVTTSEAPTGTLRILGLAGAWHTAYVEPSQFGNLRIAEDTPDVGSNSIAADMAAIQIENDDWYTVLNPFASKEIALLLAAWVEGAGKMLLQDTQDSDATTAATTDTLSVLAPYSRSAGEYHAKAVFLAEGHAASRLPYAPGSETWKFAQVKGVEVVELNETQRGHVWAKNGNLLYSVGGKAIVAEGTMGDGTFIDLIRGRDWLEMVVQTNVFNVLTSPQKTPYDDEGAAMIAGAVRGALKLGVQAGFLEPDFTVTAQPVADVNPTDKANRFYPGIEFSATTTGAFHSVGINGTVSI
jgi:hypothetical protein